jgi:hypothetical protein
VVWEEGSREASPYPDPKYPVPKYPVPLTRAVASVIVSPIKRTWRITAPAKKSCNSWKTCRPTNPAPKGLQNDEVRLLYYLDSV